MQILDTAIRLKKLIIIIIIIKNCDFKIIFSKKKKYAEMIDWNFMLYSQFVFFSFWDTKKYKIVANLNERERERERDIGGGLNFLHLIDNIIEIHIQKKMTE